MAKDVDLSSKEWRDIVFEGKNKEFGAYEMRCGSVKRHNRAMIIVIIALAIILTFLILYMKGVFATPEEAETVATVDVELTNMDVEDVQEEEDVMEQIDIPEPEPEIQQIEEDVKQQLLTEAVIVDVVDEDKKMQDQEKIKEDDSKISIKNVAEGAEDFTSQDQMKKDVIVVEEPVKVEPEKIFDAVEQMPTFPGGDAALYKFIGDNLVYPAQAAEEGVSGRVTIRFVVERDGTVSQVTVARGKHPALDKEAKRVVSKLPKFIPGKQNGQTVRVFYTLPINFKLQQ
ncbi:MAG TPA: TonB family protein [Muribaculaceae bacterium]|nr:TonB family protein [Muribaculaceae bacterium]